jgi:hypothetical protein
VSPRKISLDEMVAAISAAYGDSLSAVVLYGSAASREHQPQISNYNLLIIVKRLELARVRQLSDAARRWAHHGNPPPLTFTEAEWKASADIFPLEYADVLEGNRVLAGSLAMSDATVDLEHMRLQLEQESMGKLLALRQRAMLAGSTGPGSVEELEGLGT